ncbi:MAG: ArsR/SmtB family transcription factor [Fimbriimonadaceae bacterium]
MVKYSDRELDEVFRALADPNRRRFVASLNSGEKTVSQLHETSDMSLVAVMKHLEVLEASGLIRTEKRGRTRFCALQPERLQNAENWLNQTRTFWSQALRRLNDHFENNND